MTSFLKQWTTRAQGGSAVGEKDSMLKLLLGQWQNHKKKSPSVLANEADVNEFEQPVNRFNPLYVESDEPISITSNYGDKQAFNEEAYNSILNGHVQSENNFSNNQRDQSPITTLNDLVEELPDGEVNKDIATVSTGKKVEQKPTLKKSLGIFLQSEEQRDDNNEDEVLKVLDRAISLSAVSSEADLNKGNSETTNSSQNNGAIQPVSFQKEERNQKTQYPKDSKERKLENTEMLSSKNNAVTESINTSSEMQPKSFLYSESSIKHRTMTFTKEAEVESPTYNKAVFEKNSEKVSSVLSAAASSSKPYTKALNKKQSEGTALKKVLKVRAKAIDELIRKFQGPDEIKGLTKSTTSSEVSELTKSTFSSEVNGSTEHTFNSEDREQSNILSNQLKTIVKQNTVPEPILPSVEINSKQSSPPLPPPLPVPSITEQAESSLSKGTTAKNTTKEFKGLQPIDSNRNLQTAKLPSEINKVTKSGNNQGNTSLNEKKSTSNVKTGPEKQTTSSSVTNKSVDKKNSDHQTISFETKKNKKDRPLYEKAQKQIKKSSDVKSENIEKRISKSVEISSKENQSISSGSVSELKRNFYGESNEQLLTKAEPKVTKSGDADLLTSAKTSSVAKEIKLANTNPTEYISKAEIPPRAPFKKKTNVVKNEIQKSDNKEKDDSGENSKFLSEDSGVTRGDQTSSESQTSEKLVETKNGDTKKKSSLKVASEVKEIEKEKTVPRERKRHSKSGHRRSCHNYKHGTKRDTAGLPTNQCSDYYNKVTREFPRWHNRRPESWASDMSWDEFVSREYPSSPKLKSKSQIRRPGSVRSSYHTRSRHIPRAYRSPYYTRHHHDFHRESDDSISSYPGVISDITAWQGCQCEDCLISLLHRNFLERASIRSKSPVCYNGLCTCGAQQAFVHNGRKVKFVDHNDHHTLKESELARTEELPETDSESLSNSSLENLSKDGEELGKTEFDSTQNNKSGDFKKKAGSVRQDKKMETANGNLMQENGHMKVNGLTNGNTSKVLQPWEVEELDRMVRMRLLKKRRRRAQCMAVMALAMVVFVGLVVGIVMVYLRRKSL